MNITGWLWGRSLANTTVTSTRAEETFQKAGIDGTMITKV